MNSLLPSQPWDPTWFCQSFHACLVMIQVRTWTPSALQSRAVPSLSLAFLTLPLWRLQRVACPLLEFIWWFLMFIGWLGPGLHLGREDHRNAVFFSWQHFGLHTIVVCPMKAHVGFGHLIKVGSVKLSPGKALFTHFTINKHLVEKICNYVNIPFLTRLLIFICYFYVFRDSRLPIWLSGYAPLC